MNAVTDTMEFGTDLPTTALYRLFAADERLLYIGITDNPGTRMAKHRSDKPWWDEVSRTSIAWFATRADAIAAEAAAIREECPVHNIQGAPPVSPIAPSGAESQPPADRPYQDCLWVIAAFLRSFARDVTELAEAKALEIERMAIDPHDGQLRLPTPADRLARMPGWLASFLSSA